MNDRRDQYICAALTGVLNADGLPAEGYEKQYAKCVVEIADFALAAAGEKEDHVTTAYHDSIVSEANALMVTWKQRAEAAESNLAVCELERDRGKAMCALSAIARGNYRVLESKLAACERERDRSQSFAEGLQAELTEAIDARNAAEQSKERLAENLRKTRAAKFVCEQEAEAASIVIATLKRGLEPLTEDEATEVMRPVIYGSLPPTDDQIRSIVDDADRIRARRQP